MNNKLYKLGILVGRFQTLHTGHEYMINTAIELCDKVGIFIGSSNESKTAKNPFTYEMRRDLLESIFGSAISVYPLPDIGVGNNGTWGEYVLENVEKRFGRKPDLLVSGKEERRGGWFDGINGVFISELYVPKTIDISASKMREMFISNSFDEWKKYSNELIWDKYDELREIVLDSKDNTKTGSM